MDKAAKRYRLAMIEPGSGGNCRYCGHHVDDRHVGTWCADCEDLGGSCGVALKLDMRARERATARTTR